MSPSDPRPTAADRVRVRAGDVDLLAEVVTTDGDTVVLDLADEQPSGAGEIVFSHPRGVICLGGSFLPDGENVVFTVSEERRLEQRRGAFRLAISRPVTIRRSGGEEIDCRTGDLSVTGLRLLDAEVLDDEETVDLTIDIEPIGTVELAAQVVRRDGDNLGVVFVGVPAAVETMLSRYVASTQRATVLRA